MHYAVAKGDIQSVRRLCKGNKDLVNEQMPDWRNWYPLTWAASLGHIECALELIKMGADPFPPPDAANSTPYYQAVTREQKGMQQLLEELAAFQFNVNVRDKMYECHNCFGLDRLYDPKQLDLTMKRYTVCKKCTEKNKKTMNEKRSANEIEEKRINLTLKYNPSISVDTLCGMRDKRALEALLKEIGAKGHSKQFALWHFDIDAYKAINTALTHDVADEEVLVPMSEVFKDYDVRSNKGPSYWNKKGIEVTKCWVFRQGGDEFSMVTERPINKNKNGYKALKTQQKLYDEIIGRINSIKINGKTKCVDPSRSSWLSDYKMKHVTLSTGFYVCFGTDYKEWLLRADEMAETVKKEGKDGLKVMLGEKKRIYNDFEDLAMNYKK